MWFLLIAWLSAWLSACGVRTSDSGVAGTSSASVPAGSDRAAEAHATEVIDGGWSRPQVATKDRGQAIVLPGDQVILEALVSTTHTWSGDQEPTRQFRAEVLEAPVLPQGVPRREGVVAFVQALRVAGSEGWRTGRVYQWSDTGVRLLGLLDLEAEEWECRFEPPITILRFPVRVGETTEAVSDCNGTTGSATHTVLRRDRVDIDGQTVRTIVIAGKLSATEGDVVMSEDVTLWLSPDSQLPVRTVRNISSTRGAVTIESSLDLRLLQLVRERVVS